MRTTGSMLLLFRLSSKRLKTDRLETARIEHENQVRREENRLKAELEIKQREEETESQALEVARRLEFAQEEQRKAIANEQSRAGTRN